MIGLDTSHVSQFTKLLNREDYEYHVPGGRVVVAYPGVPSMDFEMSYSRIDRITNELKKEYGVHMVDSAEAVAEQSDAILLMSVDGRVHLELFRRIAPFGKPVFIDKPFAVDTASAREMTSLAERHGVAFMSCSARRVDDRFVSELAREDEGAIIGGDFYGPMPIQPTQPGLFWYGIHIVEMLYHTLGRGCVQVSAAANDNHDVAVGVWRDGRIGTVRGNRVGSTAAGGLIHREKGTRSIAGIKDASVPSRPAYASLVERILNMAAGGKSPIDPLETMEIIRFIEAANESRETGKTVLL
jgi:predicted dehydrogenase